MENIIFWYFISLSLLINCIAIFLDCNERFEIKTGALYIYSVLFAIIGVLTLAGN